MRSKITPDKYELFLSLAKSHTNKEVAAYFQCSEGTVEEICRKLNFKKGHRLFSLNENYFAHIDTHSKAYILGFLFSDGNVSNNGYIGWIINKKDIEVLDFCKQELGYGGEIKFYKSLEAKNAACLKVRSITMANDLLKLGCVPNKTLNLEWPKYLEDSDFIWSFLLGYLDGDGWISLQKKDFQIGIACSIPFYRGLKAFLDKHDISSTRVVHKNKNTICSAAVCGSNGYKLSSNLLKFQDFSLKRKRDKLKYIKWCHENLKRENGRLVNFSISKHSYSEYLSGRDAFIRFLNKKNNNRLNEIIDTSKLPFYEI